jgi:DNA-binding transcriptional LysR family regulator
MPLVYTGATHENPEVSTWVNMRTLHDTPRLDQLDLNLLHVFDVIAREGGLSRAAAALSLTQSAVSHALARLRAQLGDPLFVRRGRGVAPTPLAERLAPAIGDALAALERALADRREFDAGRDVRRLTLALHDELEPMLLPRLYRQLVRSAPGLQLAGVRLDRARLRADLWTGKIDLALDVPMPPDPDVRHERVLSDSLCVAASPRRRRLDRAAYLAASHVVVTSRRRGAALEDFMLGARGLERRVTVRCRRYETALAIVADSDLLLTLPRDQVSHRRGSLAVRVFPIPVRLPPMQLHLHWLRQSEDDPAHRWIRQEVRRCLQR